MTLRDKKIQSTISATDTPPIIKPFSYWKIFIPVLIGIAVVAFLFVHDASNENIAYIISSIHFSWETCLFIFLAWVFMFGRDFGLTWRFKILTSGDISWKQAIRVNLMCEFTSCVTPTSVGGSSLGMIFLHHEGVELGRSITLIITTLFLDELFFVISCPLIVLFTPINELFTSGDAAFSNGLRLTFWLIYTVIFLWTALLFFGIIVIPNSIRRILSAIFSIRFLKRWQSRINTLGDNMVATSISLRKKSAGFWIKSFGATTLSWISRYLIVNALFLGFAAYTIPEQWIIFAKQIVVWTVLTVSPTPGGSGLSEWLFTEYYGNILSTTGMALLIALCWRIISYYIYLLIGVAIIPSWLKETFNRISSNKSTSENEKK